MRRNVACLFFGVLLAVGLLAVPAHADLGLAQIMSDQGAGAVEQAVRVAVAQVYAENPSDIENLLADIVNEVELLKNDNALAAAVVAVMSTGGSKNLKVGKRAVSKSNYGKNNPAAVAQVYASVSKFVAATPAPAVTPSVKKTTVVTPTVNTGTIDAGGVSVPQPATTV